MSTATSCSDRRVAVVATIIIGVIIYGSLFPFDFRTPAGTDGPLSKLIKTWDVVPGRGNLIANVLLYAPLGFFGFLIPRTRGNPNLRLLVATLGGLVLSVTLELIQFYDAGRITHLADVYANTIGTAIGAVCARVFGADIQWPFIREMGAKPVPALLLMTWFGDRLFPFVPTINLHKYWDALKPVFLTPSLPVYDFVRYTAMWLTVCALIEAIAERNRSRFLFPAVAVFILGFKIVIVTKVLTIAELLGAVVAFGIWQVLLRRTPRVRSVITAIVLGTFIAGSRLAPFDFAPTVRPFGWIPFLSFLNGSLMINTQSFLEKSFLYGSLLWLLLESGLQLRYAAGMVAAGLFCASLIEVYLPGRSAEITDAVMVLLIAWVLSLLTERPPREVASQSRV